MENTCMGNKNEQKEEEKKEMKEKKNNKKEGRGGSTPERTLTGEADPLTGVVDG